VESEIERGWQYCGSGTINVTRNAKALEINFEGFLDP